MGEVARVAAGMGPSDPCFPEDSAGSIMQHDIVRVPATATVDEAVSAIRRYAEEVGDPWFVYVLDEGERLAGVVRLEDLLLAPRSKPVEGLMKRDVYVVSPMADQEEVAEAFQRYDLMALPVVDDRGRLLGRITYDDVVEVLEREADEDMLKMAGVKASGQELVYSDRVVRIALSRLPWLAATLAGLNVSALLYWQFLRTFPDRPELIPFIPMISAMGGNVGTQSSTIVVRGFAVGRVDFYNFGRVVSKELLIGCMMGLACGMVAGGVALAWRRDAHLAAAVGMSMVAAMTVATGIGSVVPFVFRLVRLDPAVASGPLITTTEDIVATLVYYTIAVVLVG